MTVDSKTGVELPYKSNYFERVCAMAYERVAGGQENGAYVTKEIDVDSSAIMQKTTDSCWPTFSTDLEKTSVLLKCKCTHYESFSGRDMHARPLQAQLVVEQGTALRARFLHQSGADTVWVNYQLSQQRSAESSPVFTVFISQPDHHLATYVVSENPVTPEQETVLLEAFVTALEAKADES